ncbi:undecaprenyl-diphosphatase [Halopseudomonas xinjiangensis]|uniref:undecaprenyl-diphosphate phosphatase n=1 Tax=Halopseudomonas xinjiangensis TaxID=487184 RepID=A0A1H1L737_9GAMM|nr:phosphatase PAP2 family protein [Halopseudomonas xinjiangensis]SDR70316.1 undecaprenyl-diphosphatase [Halopseudomonas xinjiangensis]
MIDTLLRDLLPLLLIVAAIYLTLFTALRRMQPGWSTRLEERRVAILLILVLMATALKVGQDVLGAETGDFDTAVLLYLNEHTPPEIVQLFAWITLTGSSMFLTPLIAAVTALLFFLRQRAEALLLAASGIGGVLIVYLIKRAVGRDRPALWETEVYWGSSFPSGHTLGAAACAMALALCLRRVRPGTRSLGLWLALTWIALVGLSRLVLGVHWPTDVMVAACIGIALPLTLNLMLDTERDRQRRQRRAGT